MAAESVVQVCRLTLIQGSLTGLGLALFDNAASLMKGLVMSSMAREKSKGQKGIQRLVDMCAKTATPTPVLSKLPASEFFFFMLAQILCELRMVTCNYGSGQLLKVDGKIVFEKVEETRDTTRGRLILKVNFFLLRWAYVNQDLKFKRYQYLLD